MIDPALIEELRQKLKRHLIEEFPVEATIEDFNIIYNLYLKNIRTIGENFSGLVYFYYGLYYEDIEINYNLMKEYYEIAAEKGNSDAMNRLGLYYQFVENNAELTKRYSLMAIEHNHENKQTLVNYLLFGDFDFSIATKYSNLLKSKNLNKYKRLSEKFRQEELTLVNDLYYHYYLVNETTNDYLENSLVYLVLSIIRLQSIYYDLN